MPHSDTTTIEEISQMFDAARSFIAGAKIVIESDGIEDEGVVRHPTLPVIVCAAIAIEIQIKALQRAHAHQWKSGDGHNLKTLFESLPTDRQLAVLDFQEAYTKVSPDAAREQLFREKDAFKIWRYPYEKQDLQTAPAFLLDFAIALSDYIQANFVLVRSSNGWLKGCEV